MDMSLSKLQETVKNREAWHVAVQGVKELDMTKWMNHNNKSDMNYINPRQEVPTAIAEVYTVWWSWQHL